MNTFETASDARFGYAEPSTASLSFLDFVPVSRINEGTKNDTSSVRDTSEAAPLNDGQSESRRPYENFMYANVGSNFKWDAVKSMSDFNPAKPHTVPNYYEGKMDASAASCELNLNKATVRRVTAGVTAIVVGGLALYFMPETALQAIPTVLAAAGKEFLPKGDEDEYYRLRWCRG